jgi:hypothetical protein
MKIIVAGGRDYSLSPAVFDLLESALAPVITELVSGGAPGVDSTAEAWARGRGLPVRRFPADWLTHGKRAGPIRNRQMAQHAEAVVLFPGGRGTDSMHAEARAAGLVIVDLRFSEVLRIDRGAEHWLAARIDSQSGLARGIVALALGFLVLTRPVPICAPGLPS